jgi:hypothetical protein
MYRTSIAVTLLSFHSEDVQCGSAGNKRSWRSNARTHTHTPEDVFCQACEYLSHNLQHTTSNAVHNSDSAWSALR